jgi:hypothetical protein
MPEPKELVDRAVFEVGERFGIRVSGHATTLLQLLLDAVVKDPHPRWRAGAAGLADQLPAFRDIYGSALPLLLTQVAAQEPGVRETGQITTFDLLHWLSGRIDSLCIIPK